MNHYEIVREASEVYTEVRDEAERMGFGWAKANDLARKAMDDFFIVNVCERLVDR